ncbi:MAG: hypothetical protein ACK40E_05485, partial [Caldimicrobium sp.]
PGSHHRLRGRGGHDRALSGLVHIHFHAIGTASTCCCGSGGGGGGGGGGGSSPLRGEFTVEATLASGALDIYSTIEADLVKLLSPEGKYSLNKLSGTLYVKDKPSRVSAIAKLVEEFRNKYRRQIILDAKIIEIALSKGHDLGVDWFEITNLLLGTNRIALNTLDFNITPRPNQPSFALSISGQPNINLLLKLLREYGELKVISNPKIRVLHSQPALISVGTSRSFIKEFKKEVQQGQTPGSVTYTTQTSSIFDGILLGITPYIAENEEIILHIVPIKSDLLELRDVRFGDSYFITLPSVNLREMTSIVKVKPNDLIIIGGLILDRKRATTREVGLPIISDIFRSSQGTTENSELVILIRVLVN